MVKALPHCGVFFFFWVAHSGLFVHLFNLPNATEVCHAWTV